MYSSGSLNLNDSPKLTTSTYECHNFTHREQNRETLFPVKLTFVCHSTLCNSYSYEGCCVINNSDILLIAELP